jgi:bifunctional DNase/RNase
MALILEGFGISIERVVVTELRSSTYFARLILKQENELGKKLVEVDARPSDCIALAVARKRPIFVARNLFDQVEDMSEMLAKMNENSDESESS